MSKYYPCTNCKNHFDKEFSEECIETCDYARMVYNLSMLAWEEEGCVTCKNAKNCDYLRDGTKKCFKSTLKGFARDLEHNNYKLDLDALNKMVEFKIKK